MKVLVVCDDLWHPAEVIELGLKGLPSEFELTVVKSAKDILTPKFIEDFAVIICCKGNVVNSANTAPWFEDTVTEVAPKEFGDYIKNGGGFLSLHSGNTSKLGSAYTDLVGNYFTGHPLRNEVDVKITNSKHPVAKNVSNFQVRDEHYSIALTCEDADIFCKTFSETGGEQIGGYTREIGSGRLCVLTPGHTLSAWQTPDFLTLLSNAINWCAGK